MTNPRPLTHYGLIVEDVEAAAEWYEDVLDFDRLKGPNSVDSGDGHYGEIVADVIDVEFFEFEGIEGDSVPDPLRSGYFHVGIAERDIEGLVDGITENGGDQRSDIWQVYPDQEYRMVYCEDPWGNVIEIHIHDFERVHRTRSSRRERRPSGAEA